MKTSHPSILVFTKCFRLVSTTSLIAFMLLLNTLLIACTNSLSKKEISTSPEKVDVSTSVDSTQIPMLKKFPYDLDQPSKTFKLPNKLKEISGLGIDSSDQFLYAVQDEEGDLFKIDKETGKVIEQTKFHKAGDYEGIEFVKDRVYVVKSTGTLYEVEDIGKPNQKRTKHKFNFTKASDIEGLGYDPETNSLLVSCKGKALKGEEAVHKKGIYTISLDSMKMDSLPRYTVSLASVKNFLNTNRALEYFDKLAKVFSPDEEFIFGPSGIAVHPFTKNIYILSAVGNVLVVLNRDNEVIHLQKLRKKVHEQPEGIVFDQAGNLYISNEGKADKGSICVFAYLP